MNASRVGFCSQRRARPGRSRRRRRAAEEVRVRVVSVICARQGVDDEVSTFSMETRGCRGCGGDVRDDD